MIDFIDWQRIGWRLSNLRRSRDMAQQTLAEKTGLSNVYIGYLEQGKRKGTIETFLLIVNALGYTMDDLLDEYITKRLPLTTDDSDALVNECSAPERELIQQLVRDTMDFFRSQRQDRDKHIVEQK